MDDYFLINQVLAGQKEEYKYLISRYQNKIYNYVYKLIRERNETEDITQETFIKAYFALASYKPEYKFSTWLYKIATNLCFNFLKKKKPLYLEDEILDSLESNRESPSKEIIKQDEAKMLEKALKRLDHKYRIVVSLYYFDQLSIKEISQVLNLPEGTVKTNLTRAKQRLKIILEEIYER